MGDVGGGEPKLKVTSEDVAWRRFGDEVVLLDLRKSTYIATNKSATTLWTMLETGATRAELIDGLMKTFEIDSETAAADVDAFVDECRRRELLGDA